MLTSTVGQILVNDALPPEMRDYSRVLDKQGVKSLLQQVAREQPDKYREISFRLNQVGRRAAQEQGGLSFGIRHLRRSKAANELRAKLQKQLSGILDNDSLDDKQRADQIVRIVGKEMDPQIKAVLAEGVKDNNPLALQVLSGSRGAPMNLASLLGSDMLYSDHRDEVIPIPVLRSYSEGLSPEEYWAGTYGARRGIIATKFATQEAGFLSKQLNQAGHRLVVVDDEGDDDAERGMIVDTDDADNEGALLARDVGPYKRNTPLTPKMLKHLSRLGKSRILVRSPLVGGSPSGGVYARDVGIRETGALPGRGEQVGLQAAQALSEPISQGQLSAKHSGGVAGQEKAVSGFQYINQLIQVPKRMQGGAAHAETDGTVQRIEDAPAGGSYVTIDGKKHFVASGFELKVKKGDEVEAGDLISDGIPNPALIVQHKGVGEGRRYFVNEFRKAMASSGMRGHRRNIELLARGLINHVRLTEETDDHVPDDVVPYSTLEHTYKPREGHFLADPKKSIGGYLEKPVLHYTIGTKVRPSMLKDFDEFGIKQLTVHKDPPPFEPHMVRGMYQLQHDPDWMTQMYGSGLKKSLLTSVARGAKSEERGTSFVPSLAATSDFGDLETREVIKPKPAYQLPKVELPSEQSNKFFGGKFKVGMAKVAEPVSQAKGVDTRNSDVSSLPESDSTPNQPAPSPEPVDPSIIPQNGGNVTSSPPVAASGENNIMPKPVNQAQARADAVQRSRSNTNSLLANPHFALNAGQVFDQDPMAGMFGLLDAASSEDARKLFQGGLKGRQLADEALVKQIAEQTAKDLGKAKPRNAPAPVESAKDSVNTPLAYSLAGMADSVSESKNFGRAVSVARSGSAAGKVTEGLMGANAASKINTAAKTVAEPVAKGLEAAGKTPVLKWLTPALESSEAAGLAGSTAKGLSKFTKVLGPAAVALEGGLVATDVYNKGWDQTTNDNAQKMRDLLFKWDDGIHEVYKKPIELASRILSPVENVQVVAGALTQTGQTAYELGQMAARNVSDWWNSK